MFQLAQHIVVDVAIRTHSQERLALSLGDGAADLSMLDLFSVGLFISPVRPRFHVF